VYTDVFNVIVTLTEYEFFDSCENLNDLNKFNLKRYLIKLKKMLHSEKGARDVHYRWKYTCIV